MSTTAQKKFATFEEFYDSLDADRHITERLSTYPGVGQQVRESLKKLYERAQSDPDFERRLHVSPKDTAMTFLHDEMANYSLSDDDLELVAGGKTTTDTRLAYDIGYAIGSVVEWIENKL